MSLEETYNNIAEDWYKDHNSDDWWVEGTNKFVSLMKSGSKILDVGCGPGVKSNYLHQQGLKVLGIDFSAKMIEIAKREYPQCNFEVADVTNLESLPNFDGIFAQAVLLHIPKSEIEKVLAGLKEKLNNDGYLYIAVKGVREGGLEEEVKLEYDYGYEYKRFFSYFSLEEIKKYLQNLHMEIVWEANNPTDKTNWVQIIAKKV